MVRRIARVAVVAALLQAYLSAAGASGARLAQGDYYCDPFWESACITNYCIDILWPGHNCVRQSSGDCECVPS